MAGCRFMVDTGATTVSMSVAEARAHRAEIPEWRSVQMSTANGVVQGWRVTLDTRAIG